MIDRGGVSVNGVVITEAEIAREVRHHAAESLDAARREAATALVVRRLLLDEANRMGFCEPAVRDPLTAGSEGMVEKEPVEASIQRLLDTEIRIPEVDDEVCRRYYEQNPERFRSEGLFEAAHILVVASADGGPSRAEARKQAQEVARWAAAAPDQFGALAKKYSACSSAAAGGILGRIGPGQTSPEFEMKLRELETGEVTAEPVETRYGFHIIKLIRRIAGRQLPYSAVKERIAEYLVARAWTQAVHQYISLLAGRVDIQGVEIESAPTPLVQ